LQLEETTCDAAHFSAAPETAAAALLSVSDGKPKHTPHLAPDIGQARLGSLTGWGKEEKVRGWGGTQDAGPLAGTIRGAVGPGDDPHPALA
jgi:hypothetical protein